MKLFLYVIIYFLFLQHNIFPQANKYPTLWKAYISVGYSNSTPGKLDQFYDWLIKSYTSAGIPIQKQKEFGRTLIFNGGLYVTLLKDIWFGLSLGYLYSPAFSNYKDYLGTLKVNGLVNSYEIAIKVKAELFKIQDLPMFISIQPGISYATANIIEELKYFDYTQLNFERQWSKYSWGPIFQSTISSSIHFGDFALTPEIGYRFAYNKVSSEDLELSLQRIFGTMDFGQYGIIFLITLEKFL